MRKESDQFGASTYLEGMTSLRALLTAKDAGVNDRPIDAVLYDPEAMGIRSHLRYLRAKGAQYGFPLLPTPRSEIDACALGNTHGGLIARCGARTLAPLADISASLLPNGFYALVDGIEDPYNFGYAIRSLYAAGVDGLILSERNWLTAAGVVARASAGASESLPVCIADAEEAIRYFRLCGYLTVAADMRTDNELGKTPLPRPLLLVAGGEKRGISRRVLDLVELRVRIPYGRDFPAALSAASAITMFAYEILRQSRL